jgi:hypothetical protein
MDDNINNSCNSNINILWNISMEEPNIHYERIDRIKQECYMYVKLIYFVNTKYIRLKIKFSKEVFHVVF